jgi:Secretion system C-terminal sorting domain
LPVNTYSGEILKAFNNIFIVLFLLLFLSTISLIAQSEKTSKYSHSNKSEEEVVYTPVGPARKSRVHLVDSEHHLNIKDGHIQLIHTRTGTVTQEYFDTLTENNTKNNRNIFSFLKSITPANDSSGWNTFAYWSNDSNNPITYFSTNWIVPSPPTTNSYQLIYLFNGLVSFSPSSILQPVLQWGKSPAGGGNYWSITNWYVWGSNSSHYFYGSLIQVSPGTELHGLIKLTSDSSNTFNYNSSFTGYALGSDLQVNNAPPLNWACETLEAYGITKFTDYSSDEKIKMSEIQIRVGNTYPSLTWNPINIPTEYGRHVYVVSNSSVSGEVDIYFHTVQTAFSLLQNYPNPFNFSTIFSFHLPFNSFVSLKLYDLLGREVATIVSEEMLAGSYSRQWNATKIASGVYFYRLQVGSLIQTKKLVLLK